MRLYSKLLDTPFIEALPEDLHRPVKGMLPFAVRYRMDNVASYYWKAEDAEENAWGVDNPVYFPSLSPPHTVSWYEYFWTPNMCKIYLDSGWFYAEQYLNAEVGALISSIDRHESEEPFKLHNLDDSARWYLQGFLFVSQKGLDTVLCAGTFENGVNSDGSLALTKEGETHSKVNTTVTMGGFTQSMSEHIKPFLLTLSFLAAKNTIVIDHDPRPKKKPKSKKKKHAKPLIPYKTLEIAPLRDVLRVRNPATKRGKQGAIKRMTIARGHFRTYREEGGSKGLFGRKIYGTFWIPSHIRGKGKPDDRERVVKI